MAKLKLNNKKTDDENLLEEINENRTDSKSLPRGFNADIEKALQYFVQKINVLTYI